MIRSAGGREKVEELRRGRERWAYDERVLGSSGFVETLLEEVGKEREERNQERKRGEKVLLELVEIIGKRLKLSRGELEGGSRRRNVVEARSLVSYAAVCGYGMSLTQMAKDLKVSKQSVLRGVERGEEGFKRRKWRLADFLE